MVEDIPEVFLMSRPNFCVVFAMCPDTCRATGGEMSVACARVFAHSMHLRSRREGDGDALRRCAPTRTRVGRCGVWGVRLGVE